MRGKPSHKLGFTLIELSIVLVIIGLIVGGVLVGQDLIRAAEVRAQISQIEKYNTAVNTFRGKYNALPGDIKDPDASSFGFAPRGTQPGQGDGNGLMEGYWVANKYGYCISGGETAMFWVDLTTANGVNVDLIDGAFSAASPTAGAAVAAANLSAYFPAAKVGGGNYIYVWSGGWSGNDGNNYFGLSTVVDVSNGCYPSAALNNASIPVQLAYSIDKKIDDGFPQSGNVMAMYDGSGVSNWAGTNIVPPSTAATAGSASTCFDNGNVGGATQQYSMTQNGGAGANCALSFRFQ